MISLIVPLYRSEPNLERLFAEVVKLQDRLPEPLELVLVNDGSPDNCAAVIRHRLPHLPLQARVVHLSRNFGSFAAIAAGLREGTGDRFAAVAADLQEPPELVISFSELRRDMIDLIDSEWEEPLRRRAHELVERGVGDLGGIVVADLWR